MRYVRSSAPRSRKTSRVAGFTLIEIMAAVFLTAIVMALAVSFQVSLGRATTSARERIRYQRQAVTLLDRVARDLEGAYFIARPESTDPLDHPWIFIANDLVGDGSLENKANAVKFVTRNYKPQGLEEHVSDLAVMSYFLERQIDEPGYRLLRWRKPSLPILQDLEYPLPDDPLTEIVGESIASFTMTFIDSNGGTSNTWNSSERAGFDSIPLAVRIEIRMIDPSADSENLSDEDEYDDFDDYDEYDSDDDEDREGSRRINPLLFAKTVILPVRPLDWLVLEQETLEAAEEAGEIGPDVVGGPPAGGSTGGSVLPGTPIGGG